MARPARALCLLLAALSVVPLATAKLPVLHNVPLGVPQEGPDVPTATPPDVVVVAFEDEYWHNTEGPRTHFIKVPLPPTGPGTGWDRIILNYRQYPSQDPAQQDPWDRLCSAGIAGVEVLRCTTPRTDFTLRKDVTEFARLLPLGQLVGIIANTGSYDQPQFYQGGQWVTLWLEFYNTEPTKALVPSPATVVPGWYHRHMCANGVPLAATVAFPTQAPSSAIVEVTLSGHGSEEFWGTLDPRAFRLYVDGQELAQVVTFPYKYANYGYYGAAYTQHPLEWWTLHQALDIAGVHTGVGEIPPYRAPVLPEHLALLAGNRTVELVGENGRCYWPASVSFLLR